MFNRTKNLFSSKLVTILFIFIVLITSNGYGETYSFAIIADPHIDRHSDHKTKLIRAVDWIIKNKDKKNIELVFVVGDIAWGGSGKNRNLKIAREILEHLNHADIPYVPVIGDNEIQRRCEKEFADTFDKQYQYLSKVLEHWRKAPTPVNGKHLQNFSFDYKGCHFVSCDFNSRKPGDESGELHEFAGGSWPWFKNDIETCSKTLKENIVIITHIGIFRTGFGTADRYLFSQEQMNKVKSFLFDYRDYVDSNYAGHIHQNWNAVVWSGLFTTIYYVRITDETWYCKQWPEADDKEVTIRLVQVDNNKKQVIYSQHIYNAQKSPAQ
ncbi:MAG: metallophosphoesterase [Sedimentisphaerales bacterium]|nr:metallophosphoesterase [Sedimentisphaerales bacterium]